MQHPNDQLSALLHELDVTGGEYRTAVQDLSHTMAKHSDVRPSDPALLAANQAARLAQQRYRRALDAYKEHFREKDEESALSGDLKRTVLQ